MSSASRSNTSTPAPPPSEGLNLRTLVIAALASAAAAIIVSRLWRAGTIMAAATTPVIVAIVKELLDRQARRVSAVAVRSTPRLSRAARTVAPPPPEADAPPPPMTASPEFTARKVYGRREGMNRRRWRLAIVTGLLAFVIAVAALTLPELLAGRSVVSSGKDTTVFGGARRSTPHNDKGTTTTESKTGTDKQDTQKQDTTTQKQPTTSTPTQSTPQATPTQPAPQQAPAQPAPEQTQPPPDQSQPAPQQQPAEPAPSTP